MRVSAEQFRALVSEALDGIPEAFLGYLDTLVVDVEPMPSARDLAESELDDPHELLGLYHGTPLTERSVEGPVGLPDRIVIYQNNIQRFCRTRRQIVRQIRTTVLHEIGHHFGLDEDELDELGYA
ncbi:MAG TPA: metallopeptidase family protein [Phycisphaerae bacterium]|nr:metallopeptidase family protein [Phycisphaerae bacterium]